MNTIDLPLLLMLLDCTSPSDCWLSDCTMNDDGIKIRKPLEEEISGREWMRQKLYEKEIQLDLPCTIKQFVDWAVLNHYDYILPTNDEELAEYVKRNGYFLELPADLLREIQEASNNPSAANVDGNTKGNNKRILTPKKKHEERNDDYISYLKETIPHINDTPEPHTFKFGRKFLQAELMKRDSQLWGFNFDEWNKQRPYNDIVKLKRGR